MALYDNKHWLLSHIRNSFIASDDSGMCEVVLSCDNVARQIPVDKYDCYPGVEEYEDEDDMDALTHSFDLNSDLQFGLRRHRSNTAQHLERLEEEKKKASSVIHVKWIDPPVPLNDEEKASLFPRLNIDTIRKENENKRVSLLTELLAKFPNLPENPFKEFASFDGNAQVGVPVKRYLIFLTIFPPDKQRFPMEVFVVSTARVEDLIGLICWKCSIEHTEVQMKDHVSQYSLCIAEDDGEVDWDFPCLDSKEIVSKFGFSYLALVEREQVVNNHEESCPVSIKEAMPQIEPSASSARAELQMEDDLDKMKSQMDALGASLFQAFTVQVFNKIKARTDVLLEISGEKLDITPLFPTYQASRRILGGKFLGRQRAETHSMEDVVACDVTDIKANSRSAFKLVYFQRKKERKPGDESEGKFKTKYFEGSTAKVGEIVRKVNHIMDVRQSLRRKEYIELRERKSHRRKNFSLGSR